MIGGGSQRLFVTHDEHLARLVAAIVSGAPRAEGPLLAAHEVPTTLRAIAEQIAAAHGRRLRAIPLAPSLTRLGLRCAEAAGVALPFKQRQPASRCCNPIPLDQVSALARSRLRFPPLVPELWLAR